MPSYSVAAFTADNVDMKTTGRRTLIASQSKIFVPHYLVTRRISRTGTGAGPIIDVGADMPGGGTSFVFSGRGQIVLASEASDNANEVKVFVPDSLVDSAGFALNLAAGELFLDVQSASTYTTDVMSFEMVGTLR